MSEHDQPTNRRTEKAGFQPLPEGYQPKAKRGYQPKAKEGKPSSNLPDPPDRDAAEED